MSGIKINELAISFVKAKKELEKNKSLVNQKKVSFLELTLYTQYKRILSYKLRKYKRYFNYIDLQQEAYEALTRALKTFDPNKGLFTSWANKYIDIRIARAANSNSTIKYPIQISPEDRSVRDFTYKITDDKTSIERQYNVEQDLDKLQKIHIVKTELKQFDDLDKKIFSSIYGLETEARSITDICNRLNISREKCLRSLNNTTSILKQKIKKF